MFIATPSFNSTSLNNSTLLLPTVSIGNVPQLTCDLLIHTLRMERVGFFDTDTVMPVAGAREGSDCRGITVPLEVYQTADKQWTCVQQRSPAFKTKRNEYIELMTAFVRDHGLKRVVLLTSADAGLRTDAQISSSSLPFRVLESNPDVQDKVPALEEGPDGVIHGSGLAKRLYIALKDTAPTTLYIMFALEGDNAMDAVAYANLLNGVYQILPAQEGTSWTPPKSWDHLFGTALNQELYQ
ncbi:PAC2 family-domain-containing protein [Syncephalastrum racemosum]|uniref:Proteasome assembly chaperone 2 n=1 Tax=Syncephalastrum racemosum TaxID=13706 RepID=A0A1X2HEZ5_SYNRA|nr:PAC2 family-domain-containing protein [Syncephalastrum racemosum]